MSNLYDRGIFCVWFDTGVYLTQHEYRAAHKSSPVVKYLQEDIEQPKIHMIAPSASTLLALD